MSLGQRPGGAKDFFLGNGIRGRSPRKAHPGELQPLELKLGTVAGF